MSDSDRFDWADFFSRVPIGVYAVSAQGVPLQANKAFFDIVSLSSLDELEELCGGAFPGCSPMAPLAQELVGGDSVKGVVAEWCPPGGVARLLRHNLVAVRSSDGQVTGYHGTVEAVPAKLPTAGQASLLGERYQRVVDQISDAMMIDDTDGRVVYANAAFVQLFGLQPEDLNDLVLEDYVAPEWRQVLRDRHERRVRGESVPSVFEYQGMRKDGTRMQLEVSVVSVLEEGVLRGTQSVIRDVSERFRLRADLRAMHRTLDSLIDQLPLAVIGMDRAGLVTNWNPAAESIFGWRADEVMGQPCPCIQGSAGAEHGELLRAIFAGEHTCVDYETHWPNKNGDEVAVAVWTVLLQDESGHVHTNISVVADIGARKSTQADYRRLFENAHDAILLVDPDTNLILEANRQATAIYGHEREQLIGLPLGALYQDADEATANCRAVSAGQRVRRRECRHRTRDGQLLYIEVNMARANYAGRQVLSSHNRDISEHKQIVARSLQSQKMEALGQLAGGVAHDFNNVLTALMGYPGLIKLRLGPDHPVNHYLDEIRSLAHRAASLTRQLLAFTRQQVLRPEHLDPGQVILGMEKMLRRLIREDIELQISVSPGALTIHADVGQLEQVVMNLAVNARDAMAGGGVLTISVSGIDIDERDPAIDGIALGSYALIAVRDTGTGIAANVRAKLFEPFFTTKPLGEGTGLGLATVQGIVKQHRGIIRVHSEVGEGAEFRVYLPRSRDVRAVNDMRSEDGAAMVAASEGYLVLLVEDDRAVRMFVRTILEQGGHRLLEALDGSAARVLVDERGDELDLILSDLVMPNGGGGELARYVAERHPTVPVLLMSGYTNEPDLRALIADPTVNYLQKPFSPQALVTEIERIVTASRSHAKLTPSEPEPLIEPEPPSEPESVDKGYRVLLVDDSNINLRLGTLQLEGLGHQVVVARNGREALSSLEQHDIDMVFMDCNMPVMDGYQATEAIRALGSVKAGVSIVAMTGSMSAEEHKRCLAVGMNDVIVKPCRDEVFSQMLERWGRKGNG